MSTTLLWLRQDLRLSDNPALAAACKSHRLLPVYIHDPRLHGAWPPGAASRWWLHHSLTGLDRDLRRLGSRLVVHQGSTEAVLSSLIESCGVTQVCWSRRYEPSLIEADRRLKTGLRAAGLEVRTFNSGLLFEPWEVMRDGGADGRQPYRVFSAYWRACLRQVVPRVSHPSPSRLPPLPNGVTGKRLDDLGLLPREPWDVGMREHWQPGEHGALARLERFIEQPILRYDEARDRPATEGTSRLSPHLHFGEIGPRQIAQATQRLAEQGPTPGGAGSVERFLCEIGWREFAHHVLFHFPHTDHRPLNTRFEGFPWRDDYTADLSAWQQGQTGIPLVDAGMRELWHTGWMHNRVRMIVASFLTKNLLIPWHEGATWFWDTLVDADLANNSLGWQWIAGCGADPAPYFRIFNPVLQGEKFDPDGRYVCRWVPELGSLPERHIHKPWAAPASVQPSAAGYPPPMLNLKASRERALEAYRHI
jgi:deoxyribodipyrimidine photo-lyase